MKIGILTYHRAENYGALLQAYALRTYLQSLGHDVSFVDYWPKYHSDYFRLFSWQRFKNARIKGRLFFLANATIWLYPRYLRKNKLKRFMYKYLGLSDQPVYESEKCKTECYDVVVYGSDQIWRKQNLGGVGFDSWYFGSENVVASKKIVYAGSMGTIDTTAEDDGFIKKMMINFDSISVREWDLHQYLHRLNIETSLVIDPVFLLPADQWRKIAVKPKRKDKYILFYNLLLTPESTRFAKRLSSVTNLPIVEVNKNISLSHIGSNYVSTASVPEFLGLIDGAEFVVSNSFHGVAFSIIFNKQFFAVGMKEKSNRVESLLQSLALESRYFRDDSKQELSQLINFDNANILLGSLVKESADYLKNV